MKIKRNENLGPISYIAVGDSLTVGIGACYAPGFVHRYYMFSEQALNRKIFAQKFARSGATTADVLEIMRHPLVSERIKQAAIITISAGGNDLIQAAGVLSKTHNQKVLEEALITCKRNVAKILNEIYEIRHTGDTPFIIRMVDLYNPFPDIDVADKWVRLFNKHLRSFTNGNIAITDAYHSFKGNEDKFLSCDRLHPNPKGYQVIAEELNKLGYYPIKH
jgi:lysophospholipase L1-like esterase